MMESITPREVRKLMREEKWTGKTSGLCPGYAQGNLVVLPREYADDFFLFTKRNPVACPVLEVTKPGGTAFEKSASNSNLTTDLPRYRIYEYGELTSETTHIDTFWQEDYVSFLLGCSFTFESALMDAGIRLRHIEEGRNVAMYITNIACEPAGIFRGNMVVSMRPISRLKLLDAISITSAYPRVHGGPVHVGDPSQIGIADLSKPDFGDAIAINEDEVPVFWACGVTPQAVAMKVKPRIMITHAPGHMFITDIENKLLKKDIDASMRRFL